MFYYVISAACIKNYCTIYVINVLKVELERKKSLGKFGADICRKSKDVFVVL